MNTPRVPPRFVPTLTEVVEFEEAQVLDEPVVVQGEPVAFEPAFTAPPIPAPAPIDLPLQVVDVTNEVSHVVANDEINHRQADALTPQQTVEPALEAAASLAGDVRESELVPPSVDWRQAVPEAEVVTHADVHAAGRATEDVPAFLLATQPMPAWSPAPASVVAEPEPEVEVSSAIVAEPAPTLPAPAAAFGMLDAEREEQIVQNVLTELQRRSDLMLEYRLRETLTPILARLCDSLIKDARQDLAATLRDVVARAVAQELTRHRPK